MILNSNKLSGGYIIMQNDMIISTGDKELTIKYLYTVEDYFTFNKSKIWDFLVYQIFVYQKK